MLSDHEPCRITGELGKATWAWRQYTIGYEYLGYDLSQHLWALGERSKLEQSDTRADEKHILLAVIVFDDEHEKSGIGIEQSEKVQKDGADTSAITGVERTSIMYKAFRVILRQR